MSVDPFRTVRLTVLVLAWVFSVLAACVGLNALVKSNQQKSAIKSKVSAPTVITISTSDILNVGIVVTAVSCFTGVLISKFVLLMVYPRTRPLATRTLHLQGLVLLFLSLWILACNIPFTIFFNTRSANVRAFLGPIELSHDIIKSLESRLGSSSVYKEQWYLKLLLGCIWPGWFFVTVAALTLLYASTKSTKSYPPVATAPRVSTTETVEKTSSEKGSVVHNETV